MHYLIGLITAIAGLFWALNRLQNSGVNLNSFNPFFWIRRRRWEKQLSIQPIHRLEKPMEAAAVLVVAMAKIDGEITREQKVEIIALFEEEFDLTKAVATESYSASSYLLKDVENSLSEVEGILLPSKLLFQPQHQDALLEMLKKVASSEGGISPQQTEFVEAVKNNLNSPAKEGQWG